MSHHKELSRYSLLHHLVPLTIAAVALDACAPGTKIIVPGAPTPEATPDPYGPVRIEGESELLLPRFTLVNNSSIDFQVRPKNIGAVWGQFFSYVDELSEQNPNKPILTITNDTEEKGELIFDEPPGMFGVTKRDDGRYEITIGIGSELPRIYRDPQNENNLFRVSQNINAVLGDRFAKLGVLTGAFTMKEARSAELNFVGSKYCGYKDFLPLLAQPPLTSC